MNTLAHETISTEELIQFVLDEMEKGKKSPVRGWSMTEILWDVYTAWGKPAHDYAREYIIKNYGSQEE
tara:strand:- start:436 stop:639 length:204 start_codon:yes stop_codon:yes gene_type:complete